MNLNPSLKVHPYALPFVGFICGVMTFIFNVLNLLSGVDDEMIQGAAQGFQEDDDDPACG
jgi:hypothetical protein